MKPVLVQDWVEIVPGWGTKMHGFSFHLMTNDHERMINNWWNAFKKASVKEFCEPDGKPRIIDVSEKVYNALVQNKEQGGCGIRLTGNISLKNLDVLDVFDDDKTQAFKLASSLLEENNSELIMWAEDKAPPQLDRVFKKSYIKKYYIGVTKKYSSLYTNYFPPEIDFVESTQHNIHIFKLARKVL